MKEVKLSYRDLTMSYLDEFVAGKEEYSIKEAAIYAHMKMEEFYAAYPEQRVEHSFENVSGAAGTWDKKRRKSVPEVYDSPQHVLWEAVDDDYFVLSSISTGVKGERIEAAKGKAVHHEAEVANREARSVRANNNYKRQLEFYERIKSTMQEHQCGARDACVLLRIIIDD